MTAWDYMGEVNVRLYIIPGSHNQYRRIKREAFKPLYSSLHRITASKERIPGNFLRITTFIHNVHKSKYAIS